MSTLRALFVHNDWARDRLLDAAKHLSDEALDRSFEMGPGSLRRTIRHLLSTERSWLDRLGESGESNRDIMLHVCNHGFHHRAQAVNMIRRLGGGVLDIDYLHLKMEPGPQVPTEYDVETITEYFRYNDWAGEQVFAVSATLDDAALDRPFEMGMGSLRTTLTHVCDAERWWLENWTRGMPENFESTPDTTPVKAIDSLAREVSQARGRHLASLANEDLGRTVHARPRPGVDLTFVLGDTMLQLCGHGTHHRAQALNMLRRLGAQGPRLDYIDWVGRT